ncbi:hypothetical protein EB796_019854 [Bugula neritina]|uniref:Uncharacterized protein n=1 Tax=Bugula neritina TaxID=10212 RepID=A0A7J7J6H7_BUGNE|nr:hypothetical protein EB796_019854 [Bugula neritina]
MAEAAGSALPNTWEDSCMWGRAPEQLISNMFRGSQKLYFTKAGSSLEHRQYFEASFTGNADPVMKYFRVELGNSKHREIKFYAANGRYSSVCVARCSIHSPDTDIMTLVLLYNRKGRAVNEVAKARLTSNGATNIANEEMLRVVRRDNIIVIETARYGEVLMHLFDIEKKEPSKCAFITRCMGKQDPVIMISSLYLALYCFYSEAKNGLLYSLNELLHIPLSCVLQCLTDITSHVLQKSLCFLTVAAGDEQCLNVEHELIVGNQPHLFIRVKGREPNSGFLIQAFNRNNDEVFRLVETSNRDCILYINQTEMIGQVSFSRHVTSYSDQKGAEVISGRAKTCLTPCHVTFRSTLSMAFLASATSNLMNQPIRIQRLHNSNFEPSDFAAMICMTLYHIHFDYNITSVTAGSVPPSTSAAEQPRRSCPGRTSINQPQSQYQNVPPPRYSSHPWQSQQAAPSALPNVFSQPTDLLSCFQGRASTQLQSQNQMLAPSSVSDLSQTQSSDSDLQITHREQSLSDALPRASLTGYYKQF